MKTLKKKDILPIIRLAIKEDVGEGDVTSRAVVDTSLKATAEIVSKDEGILAGIQVCAWVFHEIDRRLQITSLFCDSDALKNDFVVQRIEGKALSILTAERTALNFLSRMSGIATQTAKMVKIICTDTAKILDTRKTAPGMRLLDKYAVCKGGGLNHRMGLWDMVLIKDNHIAAAGSITEAVTRVRHTFRTSKKRFPVEVEVKNLEEAGEAAHLGVDRIMLDNMDIRTIRKAVIIIKQTSEKMGKDILIEVSGGLTEKNIKAIVQSGVDFISLGSLTHSVQAFDFSLQISHD